MKVNGQLNATVAPGARWVGGWVASRDELGVMEKIKISCPCQDTNPESSVLLGKLIVLSQSRNV
jgi:hypothetical protein